MVKPLVKAQGARRSCVSLIFSFFFSFFFFQTAAQRDSKAEFVLTRA